MDRVQCHRRSGIVISKEEVSMRRMQGFKTATLLITMALAIGLVLSCTSSPPSLLPYDEAASQWDATVDQHIHDAQRAGKLKQLGRQLDELQKSLSADITEFKEKATALNANYDSTKDELWQLVGEFEQKRNAALAQYRDIIFAMRREVSAEEWKALID
jgi:septal ring factor EnvC (AmiA/AmiB activator)